MTDDDYMDALTWYFPLASLFPPEAQAGAARQAWEREVRGRPLPPRPKSAIQQVVRSAPRVGRNDPCPCGSGRKHKHCCLVAPAPGP